MTHARPPVSRSATLAVVVTVLVASMTYAGAVSTHALVGYEMPAILIAVFVTDALAQRHLLRSAIGFGVILSLAWAEVANVATGVTNGPAARSASVLGICTVFALVAIAGRFPALFLIPVGGVVLGAVLLGAGGEVRIVALATVVSSVAALAVVESSSRRLVVASEENGRVRPWSVPAMCLLVVVAVSTVAITQAHHDGRVPHPAIAGIKNAQTRPPWADPFPAVAGSSQLRRSPSSTTTKPVHAQVPPAGAVKPHVRRHHHHLPGWVIALLLAFALLLCAAVVSRYLVARRSWRRLRLHLQRQLPADAVGGAWVWARLRLRLCREPLPPRLSPEAVPAYLANGSGPSRQPLGDLARLVASVAFADAPAGDQDVSRAWGLADAVASAAFAELDFFPRLQARFTAPRRS